MNHPMSIFHGLFYVSSQKLPNSCMGGGRYRHDIRIVRLLLTKCSQTSKWSVINRLLLFKSGITFQHAACISEWPTQKNRPRKLSFKDHILIILVSVSFLRPWWKLSGRDDIMEHKFYNIFRATVKLQPANDLWIFFFFELFSSLLLTSIVQQLFLKE